MIKRLSLFFTVLLWIAVLSALANADKDPPKITSTKKGATGTTTTRRTTTTARNCNRGDDNRCRNDGRCAANGTCICRFGYTGPSCQFADQCVMSNPCLNGATCISNSIGQASCSCSSAYSGQYCEKKIACNTISCSNGASCYLGQLHKIKYNNNYIQTDEWCNCTAGFTGSLCDVADVLPSLIWTPTEQCSNVLGAEFVQMPGSPSSNICCNLNCVSKSSKDISSTITPGDGTICGPRALCYNKECVNFTGVPQSVPEEKVGDVSCADYLSSSPSALTFCRNSIGGICKTSCIKYLQFTCNDTLNICPGLSNICTLNVPGSTQLVSDACPYTCNNPICTDIPLRCGATNFCLNGGTCQDAGDVPEGSKFGFQCVCPDHYTGELCQTYDACNPSPCLEGQTCIPLSTFNYVCQ